MVWFAWKGVCLEEAIRRVGRVWVRVESGRIGLIWLGKIIGSRVGSGRVSDILVPVILGQVRSFQILDRIRLGRVGYWVI
jgi:hypothetical protein